MELTPNSRIPFLYLLPSEILGSSLDIPSSVVPVIVQLHPRCLYLLLLREHYSQLKILCQILMWEELPFLPWVFRMLGVKLSLLHPNQLEVLMCLFCITSHIFPHWLLDLVVMLVLVLFIPLRNLLHQLWSLLNSLTLLINTLGGHSRIILYMSLILKDLQIIGINLLTGLKLDQTICNHPLQVKIILTINNLVGFTINLSIILVL